jgi:hypothetical protein
LIDLESEYSYKSKTLTDELNGKKFNRHYIT